MSILELIHKLKVVVHFAPTTTQTGQDNSVVQVAAGATYNQVNIHLSDAAQLREILAQLELPKPPDDPVPPQLPPGEIGQTE